MQKKDNHKTREFKLIAYLTLGVVICSNYSNFKGDPFEWVPFTTIIGKIQISLYSIAFIIILRYLIKIIGNISRKLNENSNINRKISTPILYILILVPYFFLVNTLLS